MGFEAEKLRRPLVDEEFKPYEGIPDGEGLKLKLNLSHITLEYLDNLDDFFNDFVNKLIKDEEEKNKANPEALPKNKVNLFDGLKFNIRFRAITLVGKPGESNPQTRVIHSWNLEKDGQPVPVLYDELIKYDERLISDLYDFCMKEAGNPKKKKDRR